MKLKEKYRRLKQINRLNKKIAENWMIEARLLRVENNALIELIKVEQL